MRIFLICLYHINCPQKLHAIYCYPHNAPMDEKNVPHVHLCLFSKCNQHYKSLVIQIISLIQESINNTSKTILKEQPSQYLLLCPGTAFICLCPFGSWSTIVLKNGIEKVFDKS